MSDDISPEMESSRMDSAAIDDVLEREGTGTLALTDGDSTYGVPLSFGYDGDDRLYFNFFKQGAESRKVALADATEEACFTVYTAGSTHDWQSVMVFGEIRPADGDQLDALREAIGDNAWYPDLFMPAAPEMGVDQTISQPYVLEIDRVTGIKSED